MTHIFKNGGDHSALALLKAYEAWEADIIMNGNWQGMSGLPTLTQPQYDRMIELQEWRNAVLEQSQAVALSPITEAFEQFKLAFISAGGTRNPKSASAKGWRPAEVVFTRLVRKDKHDPQAIITGTQAYAAYMRRVIAADSSKVNYVPAPKPFLNGEQFMQDWDRAKGPQPPAPSMFDVAESLTTR